MLLMGYFAGDACADGANMFKNNCDEVSESLLSLTSTFCGVVTIKSVRCHTYQVASAEAETFNEN
jgi:hypothetical protein